MPKLKPAWPFTIMLIGLLASTLAIPSAAETPLAEPCHTLMTEQECGLFLTKQEHLKPGPERDHFLAAHHLIQQEREAACDCRRKVVSWTHYPLRQQAMLRF